MGQMHSGRGSGLILALNFDSLWKSLNFHLEMASALEFSLDGTNLALTIELVLRLWRTIIRIRNMQL